MPPSLPLIPSGSGQSSWDTDGIVGASTSWDSMGMGPSGTLSTVRLSCPDGWRSTLLAFCWSSVTEIIHCPAALTCMGSVALPPNKRSSSREKSICASPCAMAARIVPERSAKHTGISMDSFDSSLAPLPNLNMFSSVMVWGCSIPASVQIFLKADKVLAPTIVLPHPESSTAKPGDDTSMTWWSIVSCEGFGRAASNLRALTRARRDCGPLIRPKCSLATAWMQPAAWVLLELAAGFGRLFLGALHSLAQCPTFLQPWRSVRFFNSSTSRRYVLRVSASLWNWRACLSLFSSWHFSR